MESDYWRDGYFIRRKLLPEKLIDALNQRFAEIADGAIAVHYANSHCEDIWEGATEYVGEYSPRFDCRLVRGQDPNNYVQPTNQH